MSCGGCTGRSLTAGSVVSHDSRALIVNTSQLLPMIVATALPGAGRLSVLDWFVIVLYAAGMMAVGVYYSRRNVTAEDYLLGGRQMKPWAIGLSLFATLLSTISYLAYPGEMIKHGPMILSGMLVYPVVMYVGGWVLIPFFTRLRVTSAYEILELRL